MNQNVLKKSPLIFSFARLPTMANNAAMTVLHEQSNKKILSCIFA